MHLIKKKNLTKFYIKASNKTRLKSLSSLLIALVKLEKIRSFFIKQTEESFFFITIFIKKRVVFLDNNKFNIERLSKKQIFKKWPIARLKSDRKQIFSIINANSKKKLQTIFLQ
jgi:hypothetical protein